MLWMTLLLALLLALAVLGFVLWPLFRSTVPLINDEDERFTELLARKDRSLRTLKELEFDHQVGKISDEDYQRLQERLSRQAIVLIQQVEKITPATTAMEAALEAEIVKLRRVQPKIPAVNGATSPEHAVNGEQSNGVAEPRKNEQSVHFCTECGTRVESTFKFCANCGAPVAKVVAE
ncbi:MAG: zinc ribbon domain-containing protein [Caldilineaceae bacterium]